MIGTDCTGSLEFESQNSRLTIGTQHFFQITSIQKWEKD
jgi:hypothetical protein